MRAGCTAAIGSASAGPGAEQKIDAFVDCESPTTAAAKVRDWRIALSQD